MLGTKDDSLHIYTQIDETFCWVVGARQCHIFIWEKNKERCFFKLDRKRNSSKNGKKSQILAFVMLEEERAIKWSFSIKELNTGENLSQCDKYAIGSWRHDQFDLHA